MMNLLLPLLIPFILLDQAEAVSISSQRTNNIIIENHDDTQEWWIAFYILNKELSCAGSIVNVEITDNNNYIDTWIPFEADSYTLYDQCIFLHKEAPFTAPITVRITNYDDKNNDTNTIIGYDVIKNLTAGLQFDFDTNFCDDNVSTLQPTIYTTNHAPQMNTSNIIITNHDDSQEWWVAFFIFNEDLSCGGLIDNVEISDNSFYNNKWVQYNVEEQVQWGHYAFEHEGEAFTIPISIRITMEIDEIELKTIVGYDVITVFTAGLEFDFGSNFEYCEDATNTMDGTDTSDNTQYIFYFVSAVFCIIGVIAFLDGKVFCRRNDYLNLNVIPSSLIQILDVMSDIFFVMDVSSHISWDFDEDDRQIQFVLVFILSIIFIIVPITISLFQLHYASSKHWLYNNRIKEWLLEYSKLLYFVSVITGSSFNAVDIFNSNMFGFDIFDMGLTKQYLLSFMTKKVYSVILLENAPQLILLLWYTVMLGRLEYIPLTSMIFSLISIILTIITMILQKRIYKTQDYVDIIIDVTGKCVMDNVNICRNRMKDIKSYLCSSVFGVHEQSVQIMRPNIGSVRNGLQIQIHIAYIHQNDTISHSDNYVALLNDVIENGSLQKIIQSEWKLSTLPQIGTVLCEFVKSKEKKQLSIAAKSLKSTPNSGEENEFV